MWNVAELEREHARVLKAHEQTLNLVLHEAGYEAFRESAQLVPRKTNRLAGNTRFRVMRSSKGRLLRLTNPTPYAAAQDTGSRPHLIRGRPWLTFVGRDGHLVRVRSVNHPGTKGTRFLKTPAEHAYVAIGDRFVRIMTARI